MEPVGARGGCLGDEGRFWLHETLPYINIYTRSRVWQGLFASGKDAKTRGEIQVGTMSRSYWIVEPVRLRNTSKVHVCLTCFILSSVSGTSVGLNIRGTHFLVSPGFMSLGGFCWHHLFDRFLTACFVVHLLALFFLWDHFLHAILQPPKGTDGHRLRSGATIWAV